MHRIIKVYIGVVQVSMIVRIVLSSIPCEKLVILDRLCYAFTEIYVFPLRNILAKKKFFYNVSIDFSYIFVSLLLAITVSIVDFLCV